MPPAQATAYKILPQDDLEHVFNKVSLLWESLRGQKIFVTGGTGFFGKWLMETLLYANKRLDLDCHVTVLSRNPQHFREHFPHLAPPAIVDFVEGDVRSFVFPQGQYPFVIHAGTDVVSQDSALDLFLSCVEGTKRVLEFARQAGCSRFLLISSGAVYGRQPDDMPAIPETYTGAPDTLDTRSAYGEGKRCAEWLAHAYGTEYQFTVKIARCFAFVGPHLALDKHFAIGNFIRDALANKEIIIQGDGTPYRSYLYSADLAIWLWTILLRGSDRTVFNVGGDEAVTIADLGQRIINIAAPNRSVKVLRPACLSQKPVRYVPDVTLSKSDLGLDCWVSLEDSIYRTLQWYRG